MNLMVNLVGDIYREEFSKAFKRHRLVEASHEIEEGNQEKEKPLDRLFHRSISTRLDAQEMFRVVISEHEDFVEIELANPRSSCKMTFSFSVKEFSREGVSRFFRKMLTFESEI